MEQAGYRGQICALGRPVLAVDNDATDARQPRLRKRLITGP
jgi:hypothetical protein